MQIRNMLGLLAVGGLLALGAPTVQAQAATLMSPGVAAAVQETTTNTAVQVQYRRHYHRRHYHRPPVFRHHYHHPRRVHVPRYHHHRHYRHHRHWR